MATAKTRETSFIDKAKRPFVKLWSFLKDVYGEMQRVVWPSHEETYGFTVVVIIAVTIVALWVGLLDIVCATIMTSLGLAK